MSEKNDNKVPNVPNLRFAEFTKEWEISTIGKTGFFYYGKSAPKWSVDKNAKNPCFRYGQLYTLDKAKIDVVETYTNIDSSQLTFSRGTEVLVPRVGEDPMDFYKCTYLAIKNVAIGEMISVYNTNENPHFMSYYFRATMRKKFARLVEGGNVSNLYYEYLKKISIKLPCRDEQKRIVHFFELLDERITTQSKIIEDLILEKNITSDKIFSQTPIRKNSLSSFYKKGKAGGTPKSTNKSYYGGDIPFLSISDMTEQGKYLYSTQKTLTKEGLENSTAWVVPKDSLILSMYASVGQVAINKIPLATSQAMFSMTIIDKNDLVFLYYFLSYFRENKLHKYLETGTQSNINADFVKSIEIPDYGTVKNEQIVTLLSLLDERIQKEKDILSLYKKQKAYLLSNMFI